MTTLIRTTILMTIRTMILMRTLTTRLRRLENARCFGLVILLALAWGGGERTLRAAGVPLIYCTDLFHPHEDPDDHFDLATLYATPGFDLRGIVLDQGDRQRAQPGRIPVAQLNHLTGRNVPAVTGLGAKLKSATDQALDQPAEFQEAVRFILETLRTSADRVSFIAVGSMRDVAAAFNREPDLFRRKAGPIMGFIGEASKADFREYNVQLDPHAYVAIMRSGLDVLWVPCFDGGLWQNGGHASFWQAKQADLLAGAAPELQQFFIYALQHEKAEPLDFLHQPVDPARRTAIFELTRNLWCTAVFGTLGRQRIEPVGDRFLSQPVSGDGAGDPTLGGALFAFETVWVKISDGAVVTTSTGPVAEAVRMRRFAVRDLARYGPGMTQATADLLARFPLRSDQGGAASK